jgi:ectoine hydroxylase-related dioxygenase (phytanoyl-CoA dioxygenase family)
MIERIRGGPLGLYATQVLGGRFVVPVFGIQMRVFQPNHPVPEAILPWHQDAAVFPPGWRFLTAWILLHPARVETAPGLAIVPAELDETLPKETSEGAHWLEADRARVAEILGRHGFVVPGLARGDALVFDQSTLHRTHMNPEATEPRVAIDMRLLPATRDILAEYERNGQTLL